MYLYIYAFNSQACDVFVCYTDDELAVSFVSRSNLFYSEQNLKKNYDFKRS